ncbi:MAG TPA: hypothetical protein VHT27_13920 [Solirubrobacteraceae bacterium]|nr:hypothetical protein [Solirubrobacteraceae bacterium]
MPEESSGAPQRDQPGPVPPLPPAGEGSGGGSTRDGGRVRKAALRRLHDASDEILAVFEHNLREDATAAGASEQEIRDAQAEHPEHP